MLQFRTRRSSRGRLAAALSTVPLVFVAATLLFAASPRPSYAIDGDPVWPTLTPPKDPTPPSTPPGGQPDDPSQDPPSGTQAMLIGNPWGPLPIFLLVPADAPRSATPVGSTQHLARRQKPLSASARVSPATSAAPAAPAVGK